MGTELSAYLDESGGIHASAAFVAGLWFTWQPELWRRIVEDVASRCRVSGELHFHKISSNPADRTFLAARDVLGKLLKYKAWYARLIYVDQDHLAEWRKGGVNAVYNRLVGDLLCRFAGSVPEPELRLVLDERNQPRWDHYIPGGLQERANLATCENPRVIISTANSKDDRLIQVADLVTAAVRQVYVPSQNPNKLVLAQQIRVIIGTSRLKVWDWPSSSATEKEKGAH